MNVSGSNHAISSTDFGFPLTFLRAYSLGPVILLDGVLTNESIIHQVFIRALIFDVIVAVLAAVASASSIYRWSASWTARGLFAFYVSCTIICVLICVPWTVDLPIPLGLPLFFVFVFAIPLLVVCFATYSIWYWTKSWFGVRPGWIGFVLVIASLIGAACWAFPHDMYESPTTADLPFLLERHSSGNPRMRHLVVRALGRVSVNDEAVVNALVDSISDANHVVRMEAMSAVTRFGANSARAVPALIDALRDKSYGFLAADALAEIGPNAKAAVPALRAALPNAKAYQKLSISEALWKIEGNAPLVVPPLIDLLHDDYGPIRRDAASILGRIGPPARAAVPTLVEMVRYVPLSQPPEQPDLDRSQPAKADASKGPSFGVVRRMSEGEFYPQIREAAAEAIKKIDSEAAAKTDVTQKIPK